MPLTRVTSFAELDCFASDLIDRALTASERADSTREQRLRLLGRVAALSELRVAIAKAVESEARFHDQPTATTAAAPVQGQTSIEDQYRARYGDDPIAPWQAEDR